MDDIDLDYRLINRIDDCIKTKDLTRFAVILAELDQRKNDGVDAFTRRGSELRHQIILNRIGAKLAGSDTNLTAMLDLTLRAGAEAEECLNHNCWCVSKWAAHLLIRRLTSRGEWSGGNHGYGQLFDFYSWQCHLCRPVFGPLHDPRIYRTVLNYAYGCR